MSKKLTPEELWKKEEKRLGVIKNKAISGIINKAIASWSQLCGSVGVPFHNSPYENTFFKTPLTPSSFLVFWKAYTEELEALYLNKEEAVTPATQGPISTQTELVLSPAKEVDVDLDYTTKEKAVEAYLTSRISSYKDSIWAPKVKLFPFQKQAAIEIAYGIFILKHPGCLFDANTGLGKTFIVLQVIRWMRDVGWHTGKTFGVPYLYVTKSPIVVQTQRVAKNLFELNLVKDLWITNYEQLRSKGGERIIYTEEIVLKGEKCIIYKWVPMLKPVGLFVDECQSLKNPRSRQSQVLNAYNDSYLETLSFFKPPDEHASFVCSFSATPLARVCEAQFIAVSCRVPITNLL